MTEHPLIVTLQLEHEAQDFFNNQRKAHFPEHLNYLDAHITLFHQLPVKESRVFKELERAAHISPFSIHVSDVYHTGFGVAYRLQSKPLIQLHAYLQEAFSSYLTPQDRQSFRPHITIQNKVSPAASKMLVQQLQNKFIPFNVSATGVDTWIYRNGPWEHLQFFGFQQPVLIK